MRWRPGRAAGQGVVVDATPLPAVGSEPDAGPVGPAMPPRRSRWARVQLNTRVRVEVEQMLQRFVSENDTTVQHSVDLALVEFLSARGYSLPPREGH